MEGGENGGGGSPASSRWNPTKEQISMLESLYMQGIRTPSAEQIQQITGRLKAYGHIEGKNVFYWFQNHKARQRQKQKQENMAYLNRFLHNTSSPSPFFPTPPPPPPPPPHVLCGAYYVSQGDVVGFYPPYPKVLLPGGIKQRPRAERVEKTRPHGGVAGAGGYQMMMQSGGENEEDEEEGLINNINSSTIDCCHDQETLPLFPLHPTGDLQQRRPPPSSSQSDPPDAASSCNQPMFDFFPAPSPSSTPSTTI